MECYPARVRLVAISTFFIIVLSLCGTVAAASKSYDRVAGFILIPIGGLALIPSLRLLFWRGPVVRIDGSGIEDFRNKCGKIAWSEVESLTVARTVYVRRSPSLEIRLHDPSGYLSNLPGWERFFWRLWKALRVTDFFVEVDLYGLKPGVGPVTKFLASTEPMNGRTHVRGLQTLH